ncbi:MAG: S-layer homology domain-containing protein [Clostridia bacterium]|nr:S-layer homology domain-containing protein [Clostridia bacterium]
MTKLIRFKNKFKDKKHKIAMGITLLFSISFCVLIYTKGNVFGAYADYDVSNCKYTLKTITTANFSDDNKAFIVYVNKANSSDLLSYGTDYELSNFQNTDSEGIATCTIKGIGSYHGTKTLEFRIKNKTITPNVGTVTAYDNKEYNLQDAVYKFNISEDKGGQSSNTKEKEWAYIFKTNIDPEDPNKYDYELLIYSFSENIFNIMEFDHYYKPEFDTENEYTLENLKTTATPIRNFTNKITPWSAIAALDTEHKIVDINFGANIDKAISIRPRYFFAGLPDLEEFDYDRWLIYNSPKILTYQYADNFEGIFENSGFKTINLGRIFSNAFLVQRDTAIFENCPNLTKIYNHNENCPFGSGYKLLLPTIENKLWVQYNKQDKRIYYDYTTSYGNSSYTDLPIGGKGSSSSSDNEYKYYMKLVSNIYNCTYDFDLETQTLKGVYDNGVLVDPSNYTLDLTNGVIKGKNDYVGTINLWYINISIDSGTQVDTSYPVNSGVIKLYCNDLSKAGSITFKGLPTLKKSNAKFIGYYDKSAYVYYGKYYTNGSVYTYNNHYKQWNPMPFINLNAYYKPNVINTSTSVLGNSVEVTWMDSLGSDNKNHSHFILGEYPQTKITDQTLINKIDASTITVKDKNNIEYKIYKGDKYLKENNTYYKVEPLTWTVFSNYGGPNWPIILSDKVIDARTFNDILSNDLMTIMSKTMVYQTDSNYNESLYNTPNQPDYPYIRNIFSPYSLINETQISENYYEYFNGRKLGIINNQADYLKGTPTDYAKDQLALNNANIFSSNTFVPYWSATQIDNSNAMYIDETGTLKYESNSINKIDDTHKLGLRILSNFNYGPSKILTGEGTEENPYKLTRKIYIYADGPGKIENLANTPVVEGNIATQSYCNNSYINANPVPNTDCTFMGWKKIVNGVEQNLTTAEFSQLHSSSDIEHPNSILTSPQAAPDDLILVAKFKGSEYTVTYKVGDDTYEDKYLEPNSNYEYPDTDPTKEGYIFKGWSLDGTNKISDTDKVTSNIEVHALFEPISYKIKFNYNGATEDSTKAAMVNPQSFTYEDNKALTESTLVKKQKVSFQGNLKTTINDMTVDYKFDGWNDKEDLSGTNYTDKQVVTKLSSTNNATVNLYAKWLLDSQITLPSPDIKDGYTFNGWYDNDTKIGEPGETVSFGGNKLTAKTTPNNYVITLDYADTDESFNKSINNIDVTFSNKVGTLPEPTKEGKIFDGWYYGNTKYTKDTSYNVADNITLVAKFKDKNSGGGSGSGSSKPNITTSTITVQTIDHEKYMIGFNDNTFKPNDKITRAEVAAIISRVSNNYIKDKNYKNSLSYNDVTSNNNSWYSNYVGYVKENNLMIGTPDNNFYPNRNISRAEFVQTVERFLNIKLSNTSNVSFKDVEGHWYTEPINVLSSNGYIDGYNDGTFKPLNDITRAEAVKIINLALNRKTNKEINNTIINETQNKFKDLTNKNAWYFNDIVEATYDHNKQELHK